MIRGSITTINIRPGSINPEKLRLFSTPRSQSWFCHGGNSRYFSNGPVMNLDNADIIYAIIIPIQMP
ncbi:unnamed protein product [Haemonchus placei]|uniref:Uncharacterized protein n=1 Tax=Haemonchus placei TaxID=6290 RepID=A0A0N4WI09_HAEPC|nr:unnamed protein product [Haemonchus placei]